MGTGDIEGWDEGGAGVSGRHPPVGLPPASFSRCPHFHRVVRSKTHGPSSGYPVRMPSPSNRPRRTKAQTAHLRAEVVRLSVLGLSQRKIAGVLEVSQGAVWKILKQHREHSGTTQQTAPTRPASAQATSKPENRERPTPAPRVAGMAPADFTAHAVPILLKTGSNRTSDRRETSGTSRPSRHCGRVSLRRSS